MVVEGVVVVGGIVMQCQVLLSDQISSLAESVFIADIILQIYWVRRDLPCSTTQLAECALLREGKSAQTIQNREQRNKGNILE